MATKPRIHNFLIAERKFFSGNPERWKLRNQIKQHPMIECVRSEALFTQLLKQVSNTLPSITAEDCAMLAARRMLELLDSIAQ